MNTIKDPKFWAGLVGVGILVAGLSLGVDFKKLVCDSPAPIVSQ